MSRAIHPLCLYEFMVSIQTIVPLPSHKAHKLQVPPPIYTIIMSYHFLQPSINAHWYYVMVVLWQYVYFVVLL